MDTAELHLRLDGIENRMTTVEHRTAEMASVMENGIVARVERQTEILSGLQRILQGDSALHVTPLRDEVKTLSNEITRLNNVYARAKWIAIGLGITNISAAISFISSLF